MFILNISVISFYLSLPLFLSQKIYKNISTYIYWHISKCTASIQYLYTLVLCVFPSSQCELGSAGCSASVSKSPCISSPSAENGECQSYCMCFLICILVWSPTKAVESSEVWIKRNERQIYMTSLIGITSFNSFQWLFQTIDCIY